MRQYLIAGNWKMNTDPVEAAELAAEIAALLSARPPDDNVSVALCPPFTSLVSAGAKLKESKALLGAQNCHHEAAGAFTGEIAAPMLAALGCTYVILGHSERRRYCGESDSDIRQKIAAAMAAGLTPIYCVGETLEERQAEQTLTVIERQLRRGLDSIALPDASRLVVAYEPVWAIGSGLAASAEQAQEVHAFIRAELGAMYGEKSESILLLYGGSMKASNAPALLAKPDVNGGLIGGASLDANTFVAIAQACGS